MRRFTRLTNAFSKKIENHVCAIALHCMFYNFARIHQTLKITPAMAAGVTTRLWEMTDIFDLIDAWEAKQVRQTRLPLKPKVRVGYARASRSPILGLVAAD